MPFISEYLYHDLSGTSLEDGAKSIMISSYPTIKEVDSKTQEVFKLVIEAIVSIRRAKATIELGNKEIPKAYIKLNSDIDISYANRYINRLARVSEIEFVSKKQVDCISDISDNLEVFLPLEGIDLTPIINRLTKQKEKLEKEFAKLNGMLSNERFVANAPKEVVEENKKALEGVKEKLEKVKSELESLS
jgi:valyl-tRNA synthetase